MSLFNSLLCPPPGIQLCYKAGALVEGNCLFSWLYSWLVTNLVIQCFFSGTHPGRTRGWIFTVYGTYDMFSPKDGPFGGCDNIGIHLGVIAQKLPKGAWIGNFKPNGPYMKIAISCKVYSRSTCNFRTMLGPWNTSRGSSAIPLWRHTKSKLADGRHFENRKYAITRPRIVRSSPNFARRRRNNCEFVRL